MERNQENFFNAYVQRLLLQAFDTITKIAVDILLKCLKAETSTRLEDQVCLSTSSYEELITSLSRALNKKVIKNNI